MQVITTGLPWSLDQGLIVIINQHLQETPPSPGIGCVLTFKDPSYCPEQGGYHPVEIALNGDGSLCYITDFAYVGCPPYAELAKEVDFDFDCGLLQHFGHEYPIAQGAELFELWQSNFISYYRSGVYWVTSDAGG